METLRPSIVIYLEGDRLYAESYRNGARIKVPLLDGLELATIRSELWTQKHELDHRAEDKQRADDRRAEERHRRVFATMASRQGLGFAKSKLTVPRTLSRTVRRVEKEPIKLNLDDILTS